MLAHRSARIVTTNGNLLKHTNYKRTATLCHQHNFFAYLFILWKLKQKHKNKQTNKCLQDTTPTSATRQMLSWTCIREKLSVIKSVQSIQLYNDKFRGFSGRTGSGGHLPGWKVGLPARWATISNVEVVQLTWAYITNWSRVETERKLENERHSQRGKEGSEMGRNQGTSAMEGRLYFDISAEVPEFLVTTLLMGPVCLRSQCQFEGPSCLWEFLAFFPAMDMML